jgi:hypothetical protein
MTFGRSQANFWINQPEAVAQLVMTRLRLNYSEWFADMTDGTPWRAQVLGNRTQGTRDAVVRSRVFGTSGVSALLGYNSVLDPNTRNWTAAMTVQTIYGPAQVVLGRLPGALPEGPPLSSGVPANLLGVLSGKTILTMTPADLAAGPRVDVADFLIRRVDAGHY